MSTDITKYFHKILVGESLRKLRTAKGLTLDQVAEETGLSKQSLWRYENEKSAPTGHRLTKLFDFFCANPSVGMRLDLLGEIAAAKHTSPLRIWLSLGYDIDQLIVVAGGIRPLTDDELKAVHELWSEQFPGGKSDMQKQVGNAPLVTIRNLDQVFMPEQGSGMRAGDQVGSPSSKLELERVDLLLGELENWARRTVLANPQAIDDLELAARRFMNEVEQGRLIALKMEIMADPKTWGEIMRALGITLPALERQRLLDCLNDPSSCLEDLKQRSAREMMTDGEEK